MFGLSHTVVSHHYVMYVSVNSTPRIEQRIIIRRARDRPPVLLRAMS